MEMQVRFIKGVGPKKEKLLHRLGIYSLRDLLYYFPVRYQDRTSVESISSLKEGKTSLIKAELAALNVRRSFKARKTVIDALLRDSTGVIPAVWFNQPYLKDYLRNRQEYYFYGRVQLYKEKLQLVSPEFERFDSADNLQVSGIVPFYRLTQKLTQNTLRKVIHYCLNSYSKQVIDPLPFDIRKEFNLPNIIEALSDIHFPGTFQLLKKARERFIFEEFFILQILLFRRKAEFRLKKRTPLNIDYKVLDTVKRNFGFPLTTDQERTIKAVLSDLTSFYRSSRLLQGDVGSGKTIVASIASFCVAGSGYQVAFMVPTEVLAIQHKQTLTALGRGLRLSIEILTSGISGKRKEDIYKKLAQNKIDIIVGTHALLQEDLRFKNLRLIIIDEQHRFGVAQRAILARKGVNPDILVMSATPIPRSLALTIYGDLEVSLIREYPKGRALPQTEIVGQAQRKKIYQFIKDMIKKGRQAYIIYALVEEVEESDLYSAVQMYERLIKEFKPYRLGLLHGKLDSSQKQKVLGRFKEGEIDILVSTLVVEVGIDVPNATVMVVENPERFGLAQLHQLRGRIMRSSFASYFFMVAKKEMALSSRRRLEVIKNTNDGFRIAEEDLELRGPGDLFGTLQAGYLPINIASVQEDLKMLEAARVSAFNIIKKDPRLELRQHESLNSSTKDLVDKCLSWQAT